MEKFTQEVQNWKTEPEPHSQSFMEQTIQELDRIVGFLNNSNDRLDKLSNIAGERNYTESCKSSCSEVQKSPESRREMITDLIYIIKSKLDFQEDRILELERFI